MRSELGTRPHTDRPETARRAPRWGRSNDPDTCQHESIGLSQSALSALDASACVLLYSLVSCLTEKYTDARTHRDRYTQISGRRQRRRVYARFTVASRVVYSTLHSARTTHTHARPALCTRALERVCWEPNSVSSLCTLRLVLRRGPGFHLQRVYLWHLLR